MKHRCSKCGEDDLNQFWKNSSQADGLASWCKSCNNENARVETQTSSHRIKGQLRNIRTIENSIYIKDHKRVCSCGSIFTIKYGTHIRCNECETKKNKSYRARNLDSERARSKSYYEANKEQLKLKRQAKRLKD